MQFLALQKLYDEGYEIPFVVTQPDTSRDRGRKVKFSAVKEKALELGIKVLQPQKVKNDKEFIDILKYTSLSYSSCGLWTDTF